LNRLAREKSPYLLQHAGNPVDWYPWGEEAFARARAEDKPIFLSIGYSTCHWCHVMAHESFADDEVAALMNEVFISIKVDREERPDVDSVYMTACHLLGQPGGWPLTVILTPDHRPFYAATYLPKTSQLGRIGMLDLIPKVRELWRDQRPKIESAADQARGELTRLPGPGADLAPDEAALHQAFGQLDEMFDPAHGGFSIAPKFPTPSNLTFLLRYHRRAGSAKALAMAESTLSAMMRGGIYDHLGGGFHRYATDRAWLVPHFEKMLSDQALLIIAYTDAYWLTGNPAYERTVRETIAYVRRDLAAPEGGFASAEDADSEGVEGKFYLWTEPEVRAALSPEEADLAVYAYNLRPSGNFSEGPIQPSGHNILHRTRSLAELATDLGLREPELTARLEAVRGKLLALRAGRVRPGRDDKVLTDWNALMIAALARAAAAFDDPDSAAAAERAVGFILTRMRAPGGRLLHRFRDGEAAVPAFLDDYAFLVWALLELYEATFNVHHLEAALDLTAITVDHFRDPERGGFRQSADDGEALLARPMDAYDGALPSGNSVTMMNLLRLARMTGRPELEALAEPIARAFMGQVQRAPAGFTHLLSALDFALGPGTEVVVSGELAAADTQALIAVLRSGYAPNRVVVHRPPGPGPRIVELAGYVRGLAAPEGKAVAYVCHNHRCELPAATPEALAALLADRGGQ
jgi:uncharacterized protein